MKDVLFITTQFPYPLDNGGKIGAYNGLSVLDGNYHVTVLSFTEELDYVQEGMEFMANNFSTVKLMKPIFHDIHIRNKKMKLFSSIILGYIRNQPYIVSKFYNADMFRTIDELFQNKKEWDFLFIDYLNMQVYGDYIMKKYSKQIGTYILKDHNIEYDNVKQEAKNQSGLKRLILDIEWRRTKKYEVNAVKKAQLVFSVCEENKHVLKEYNELCFTMLPTYNTFPSKNLMKDKNNILYLGNLSWQSNWEGLKWFVYNVFPLVRNSVKDTNLVIVGSGPSSNEFKDIEGIEYLGYVKDISTIYDDKKVFIVPLFEGSGIRIKILDSFIHEVPVVSTHKGCGTIEVEDGKQLYIADTVDEFAKKVIHLLENNAIHSSIRDCAKQFMEEKFSLEKRKIEFIEIIKKFEERGK